jgi:hypothetical protein
MLYVPTKINKSIVSYSVKFLLAATCLITKKKKNRHEHYGARVA